MIRLSKQSNAVLYGRVATKEQISESPKFRFAAAYIRVSTDDQDELSPESQLDEIRKYAKREGIILLEDCIYIEEPISGRKAKNRPKFQEMIARAKESDCPFSVILLWKFARFARNQEESIFYKSILRSKCKVDVVSITEPLIAGPFGKLIERIIEWMDEFYSIRLSQEVKRCMRVNAERGKRQCTASFGYRLDESDKMVPDPAEADYVRRIFDEFIAGKGLFPIAKEMNALGVKTHRGNPFENRTVEYIIRNPVYIGKLRWNPEGRTRRDFFNENIIIADGDHEPIIDLDTWEAAQRRMDEVKSQWGYKARPSTELKHWMSGIVRCSACGATLVFAKPHYFKCGNYTKGRCTHTQHIRVDLLEDAIISRLGQDATSSTGIIYDITYTNASEGRDLVHLEAALRILESKKERLQEAYLAGVIELDDFSKAKKALEENMAQTAKELEERKSNSDEEITRAAIKGAISTALETLRSSTATTVEKNNAARSVIENCVFDKDSYTLAITYRIIL